MGTGAFLVTFWAVKKSLAAEIRGQTKSSFILQTSNTAYKTIFPIHRPTSRPNSLRASHPLVPNCR